MKINRLILLCFALLPFFMFYGADHESSSIPSGAPALKPIAPILSMGMDTAVVTALATSLHTRAKKELGLDIDYNAQYLIQRIQLFLSFRAVPHVDIHKDARSFCYINQLDYTTDALFFERLLTTPTDDVISETKIAYDFSLLLCKYWHTIIAKHNRPQTSTDLTSYLTFLARKPLTQDQITSLAQEAIASCITPQTCKYEKTLKKKLAALLTFRSTVQPEKRGHHASRIIQQQRLDIGYIQVDQHNGPSSTSDANKEGWFRCFRNKLLTESPDAQAEISWAYGTASLLVQYILSSNAYMAKMQAIYRARKRECITVVEKAAPINDAIQAPSKKKRLSQEQSTAFVIPNRPHTLLDFTEDMQHPNSSSSS